MGVDVGDERKGFDIAVVDELRLLQLAGRATLERVIAVAEQFRPKVVAIDSPRSFAPAGATARQGERDLNRTVCGIRWTPDESAASGNSYYGWIFNGLKTYEALEGQRGATVIEVFPTASWTRWYGKRGAKSRRTWSAEGLAALGVADAPARTNQDQRDAIAAAVTARQHSMGETEAFGEIIVPMKHPNGREITPKAASTESEPWTVEHFSQANPKGPGQADVPALLRRVANSIEDLDHVEIQDLILHTETTAEGPWHNLTVYYTRP
jgi:predicted nuclease with RNAse H fold